MNANAQRPNRSSTDPNNQPRKSYSEWDWQNSTYMWRIYLNPNHPTNKASVEYLTGYSKKTGQNEAQDKENLLRRKIFTLCRNGYFDRMYRIDFFQKIGEMMNIKTAPKILTVYPDHYDIPELNHDVIYKLHGKWLHEFYYRLKNKKDLSDLMPNPRDKKHNADDALDVTKHDFKNVAALYQHATKCLHYGHAQGQVEHFIREYKQRKKW